MNAVAAALVSSPAALPLAPSTSSVRRTRRRSPRSRGLGRSPLDPRCRVGHATEILGVEVTRAALRPSVGSAPEWKRWQLSRAVRRAAARRRGTRPGTHPPPRRPKDAPWREGALRYASQCPLATPPCCSP
jgi:hypothetical protein